MILICKFIRNKKTLKRKMVEPTTTIIIIGVFAFLGITGLAITINERNKEIIQLKTQNQILQDKVGEIGSKNELTLNNNLL